MSDVVTPIFKGAAFDAQETQIMGSAFEKACKALNDGEQPDLIKEIVAKHIVEAAKDGERDPDRLCERALIAMGVGSLAPRAGAIRSARELED
jgi:hypothetical protein